MEWHNWRMRRPRGEWQGRPYDDEVWGREEERYWNPPRSWYPVSGGFGNGAPRRGPRYGEDAYERGRGMSDPRFEAHDAGWGRGRGGSRSWQPGSEGWGAPGLGDEDEEVRQAVRASLAEDLALRFQAIEVRVTDGVVELSGDVPTYLEARYAWDDAWDTPGVRGVVNRLRVAEDEEAGREEDASTAES